MYYFKLQKLEFKQLINFDQLEILQIQRIYQDNVIKRWICHIKYNLNPTHIYIYIYIYMFVCLNFGQAIPLFTNETY